MAQWLPQRALAAPQRRPWRTKADGFNAARRVWECRNCGATVEAKPGRTACGCGARSWRHFASTAEFHRWRHLLLLREAGQLDRLEHQPEFPLTANGIHVAVYRADFRYRAPAGDRGQWVVEDVKGTLDREKLDPVALLKIRWAEALHGIEVRLVK